MVIFVVLAVSQIKSEAENLFSVEWHSTENEYLIVSEKNNTLAHSDSIGSDDKKAKTKTKTFSLNFVVLNRANDHLIEFHLIEIVIFHLIESFN